MTITSHTNSFEPSSRLSSRNAVSLFSGCGGLCEGIRLANFDVLSAVEWDKYAAQTYRHNFPDVPLYEGDVTHFRRAKSREWLAEEERFRALEDRPIDLLFGGPPCQGYSQIGPRDVEDERNALYGQYVRVLRDLRPRVFLMENVPNMLLLRKGLFKNRALVALKRAGYSNCDVRVLAASDFGVPQLRKRAVFFGVRDDLDFPYDAGKFIEKIAELHRVLGVSVWEGISDLPSEVSKDDAPVKYPRAPRRLSDFQRDMRLDRDGRNYSSAFKIDMAGGAGLLHNHHTKEIQARRAELITHLAPGMKGDSLPKEIWNGLRPEKWRRLHPDKPAYTILAQMHRDLSEWVHPYEPRWITVREAARLQSFHDGFVFKSSEWQQLKQIGNAVPPLLGKAMGEIAGAALSFLDGGLEIPIEAQMRLRELVAG
jgi:DNA (cytosine-5)-methyltransferase 1